MKKILIRSVFMLIVGLTTMLSSCSDNKDDVQDLKSQIIGTWEATAVKVEGKDGVDITNYPSLSLSATFFQNGNYSGRGALGNGSGTYTISGKTIKTYIDGELYATYYVKSISDSTAELTLTIGTSQMDLCVVKR